MISDSWRLVIDHWEDRIHWFCPRRWAQWCPGCRLCPSLWSERSPCKDGTSWRRLQMNSSKSKSGFGWTNKFGLYFNFSTCQYKWFRLTGKWASSPQKGFPSSKRGNNTIWHKRQKGQTATEQPAQTQVKLEHRWLSGRRGMRMLYSHSTQVKAKERKYRHMRITRDFGSCTTPRYHDPLEW